MNKLIHEPVRLKILTHLATSEAGCDSFPSIKDVLELTAGNLSIQIKKLEEVGYVKSQKDFYNNKPRTTIVLTEDGKENLLTYLESMETLIKNIKSIKKKK